MAALQSPAPKPKPYMSAPELEDERQASVLYSPFRDKTLNPLSWNRKMKFWERLLQKTFKEQNMVSFDIDKLPAMFERNGLTPKCLATVVQEMRSSGQICPVAHYQRSSSSSWLSWGFNALVRQPLYWGVTQLTGSQRKDTNIFVSPEVLKSLEADVLQLHLSSMKFSLMDSLIPLAQLRDSCQELLPEDRDFDIVISQLERDKHIALVQADDSVIVKFRREGESAVTVKDVDINLYRIKTVMEKLEKEIQILSSRVTEHLTEAKLKVKEGNKKLALMNLRRKASLMKAIEKKSGSLSILQDIVQKIEDAGTNDMILKACDAGAQAMKALNEEVTAERADAVMDDLHEALSNQEEVKDILSSSSPSLDDADLERDLADLLRDDSQQECSGTAHQLPPKVTTDTAFQDWTLAGAEKEDDIASALSSLELDDIAGLPDVPTHSPSNVNKQKSKTTSSIWATSST